MHTRIYIYAQSLLCSNQSYNPYRIQGIIVRHGRSLVDIAVDLPPESSEDKNLGQRTSTTARQVVQHKALATIDQAVCL